MYVPDLEILHTNTALLKPGIVLIYFSSRYDLLRKTEEKKIKKRENRESEKTNSGSLLL